MGIYVSILGVFVMLLAVGSTAPGAPGSFWLHVPSLFSPAVAIRVATVGTVILAAGIILAMLGI